jgi:hypothetical protein
MTKTTIKNTARRCDYDRARNKSEDRELPEQPTTTVPIELDENWCRLPKPKEYLCALGRTYLYQLAKTGKIKSVSLRQPGKARGVRLVYKPSIIAFIEAQSAQQNDTAKTAAGARS